MAERPPSHIRAAWEEDGASQESSSPPELDRVSIVQPLQTDGSRLSAYEEEEETMRCIQAFLTSTTKDETQKMRFLQSIRAICRATRHKGFSRGLDVFCRGDELAGSITVLLKEEPRDHLRTAVRQQAMLAISALSSVEMVPEDQKTHLLDACFSSVFCLPPKEDMQGLDASLYHETLRAMDCMLQTLVLGSPASRLSQELQSILQMLLTFTKSQSAAARERAVRRIGMLIYLMARYPSLEAWCPFGREDSPACYRGFHMPKLGQLLGHLILLSSCKDKDTSCAALDALYLLLIFLLQQRCSAWPENSPQHQSAWGAAGTSCLSLRSTRDLTKAFGKYLRPGEKTDVILTAIKAMTDTSTSDNEGASSMLDEAMKDPDSWLMDVPKIVSGIHKTLERICTAPARHSIDSLLLLLTNQYPSKVVRSLLEYSKLADSAALAMWKVMFSLLQPLEKVLRELCRAYRKRRVHMLFGTVTEDSSILCLAIIATSNLPSETFAASLFFWESLRDESLEVISLVLQGLITLSQRPEMARKMKVLLEDIVKILYYTSEDIQMKALLVFRNALGRMTREEASPIALKLAEKLLLLFNNASSQLRESSIRLFRDVMQMVVWTHRRQMRKKVQHGLLLLLLHMSDENQSVAKASRDTLLSAAEFLEQKQLKYLAQTEQPWRIGECLLMQDRNSGERYLRQSLLYLHHAQATVREEAIRLTGLAARHLRDQSAERMRQICDAIKPLQEDIEPSVRSLAAQTMLIVGSPRKRPASGWTRVLCCWPCKARGR